MHMEIAVLSSAPSADEACGGTGEGSCAVPENIGFLLKMVADWIEHPVTFAILGRGSKIMVFLNQAINAIAGPVHRAAVGLSG